MALPGERRRGRPKRRLMGVVREDRAGRRGQEVTDTGDLLRRLLTGADEVVFRCGFSQNSNGKKKMCIQVT